jgi:hypothetical protein
MNGRPLMRLGVKELEELYTKGCANAAELTKLEGELVHRHVPRAQQLLAKVRKAQRTLGVTAAAEPQQELRVALAPPAPPIPLAAFDSPRQEARSGPSGNLSVEQAYRTLRIGPSASWEDVELARRRVVQKSSPEVTRGMPERDRLALLAEARHANAAYEVLLSDRARSDS